MVKKISIIIATKDEEDGIAKVLCSIPKNVLRDAEVIVADYSKDLTPIIAKKLGAKILVLKKDGKGFAMKKAVEFSSGRILVFLDGDGSDPPIYIPMLMKKLENADIVLGTRHLMKGGNNDAFGQTIFTFYSGIVCPLFQSLGMGIYGDPLAGFRAMRRKTWDALNIKSNDFLIETEINIKGIERGLKIVEVNIPLIKRSGGLLNSKLITNPYQCAKILNYVVHHVQKKHLKKEKNRIKMLLKKIKVK